MADVGVTETCNITRKRGDRRPFILTLRDSDGNPIDVAGFTAILTVNTVKDPNVEVSPETGEIVYQTTGAELTSPTPSPLDGKIRIDMSDFGGKQSPSAAVQPGNYFYDIEVTDVDGFPTTVLEGKFSVKQDITK